MKERQWLIGNPIVAGVLLLMAALVAAQVWLLPEKSGAIWVIVSMAIVAAVHMTVRLEARAIRMPFFPVWRRSMPLADIASFQIITYRPLGDFGGWGIRYGLGAWAYTVWGKQGILPTLRNGKRVLLGTRRGDAWRDALRAERVPETLDS